MPNGFDFVDQLFSGFIAFVYNFFETAFRLLTRPSRAPSDLLRRCRAPKMRQISGVTCLALSVAGALMLMLPLVPSAVVAGIDLRALLPTVDGKVQFATVVPFLIGGIAAAILVDALARAGLAAFRVPLRRRAAILSRLAYAFSFFPIAVSIYVALFRFTPWLDWLATPGDDGKSGAELFVPMLLLLRGARLVGTTAVHQVIPAARQARRITMGNLISAMAVFMIFAAAYVGGAVTSVVSNQGVAAPARTGRS